MSAAGLATSSSSRTKAGGRTGAQAGHSDPTAGIEQITTDRIQAVGAFGFTERQARFLVTVMLHSGVFVERQYCAFAGIVHGQKTHDFLRRLIDGKFAAAVATGPLHRGRLIHVQHKRLYPARDRRL